MKQLTFVICLLCFFNCHFTYGQFTRHFDGAFNQKIRMNDNEDLILTATQSRFSRISPEGELLWTKVLIDSTGSHHGADTGNSFLTEECEFTISRGTDNPVNGNRFLLSFINGEGQVNWTKFIRHDFSSFITGERHDPTTFLIQDQMYICGNYFNQDLNRDFYLFVVLDLNGDFLWHKSFIKEADPYTTSTFHKLDNNLIAVVRNRLEESTEVEGSEIVLFNSDLEFQNSFKVGMTIQNIYLEDDKFYLMGYKDENRSPKILCLNSKLEIKWNLVLKSVVDEYISSFFGKIDGGFVVKTRVKVERSEIITVVSELGEHVSSHRFARSTYSLDYPMTTNSDHIAYTSQGATLEEPTLDILVSLANVNFDNLNCYIPEACMEVDTFSAKIKNIQNPYTEIEIPIEVGDVSYSTIDATLIVEDVCTDDFGQVSVPLFSTEDTICVGELVPLYNIRNRLAPSVEWNMPGSDIGSSFEREPTFSYLDAGQYTITHIVEYRGCFSEYSVDIVVVPPVDNDFELDNVLCEPGDFLFDVTTEGAESYLWKIDSSRLPTFLANSLGSYEVQITDKYCVSDHVLSLSYFDYSLIEVDVGKDTAICLQKPLDLSLNLDTIINFAWNDGNLDLKRSISESGEYTLVTSIGECSTQSSIRIDVEDCSTKIYLPNAFSPNGDGINDTFYPLGDFFEVVDFKIYDRWGNQLHDRKEEWDGTFRAQVVATGVYAYSLVIFNPILNEQELLKGDVVVVK